ncbi:hypothetical protein FB45DRAFT_111334 [Roridomyces roridus]|uniref:Uncharacterized protein n=1 Tax=Roridomyces roridus TaxID=1738132 RepID=A0AAD7BKM8_9AGAR|nr:hypothetical protein FB45DRAFT_111334 [Roridomyces roridus]
MLFGTQSLPHPEMERQPVAVNSIVHYLPALANGKDSPTDSVDPQLILIFSWMDGQLRHIMKYSQKYSALFPSAAQIIIQADKAACYTGSSNMNMRRIHPVVKLMVQNGLLSEHPPRMLFHAFSGGGACQLLWLARALRDITPPKKTSTGIIFDSVPGTFNCRTITRFTIPPSPTLYQTLLGSFSVVRLWTLNEVYPWLYIRPGTVHQFIHDGMNHPRMLEWTDSVTPRLYLYSDADYLMQVASVRAHIAGVRKAGMMNVSAEEFRGSEHVQHAHKDPERYWGAVRQLWADVVQPKAKL